MVEGKIQNNLQTQLYRFVLPKKMALEIALLLWKREDLGNKEIVEGNL